ncbi:MAG: cardiolipin synthase [Chitinophagales bacterium]|nr:cardiolipin synthase [Chitinophagales bacterium]
MHPLLIILEILYVLFVIGVCLKIIFDTDSPSKSIAYILFIIIVPIIGVAFYFAVGFNYKKHKIYSKKIISDKKQFEEINQRIIDYTSVYNNIFEQEFDSAYTGISKMLYNDTGMLNTKHNEVQLLVNGEEKYPELLSSLKNAKNHIHIEYYIYDNDTIGNEIADILIAKAKEGLEVRMIYDDFGSNKIRRKFVKRLKENGVEVYPFFKILFINFANRLNYRNHRKIVVIDGHIGFVGGINIADNYDNTRNNSYWRDTHLKIVGESVSFLQSIFIADWNFCSGKKIEIKNEYFNLSEDKSKQETWTQIVPSGPDSENPAIYYTYLQALHIAQEKILITTPYFIPSVDFIAALKMAVLRGVEVILLIPGKGDSLFVNIASQSFYEDLLKNGIKIFRYKKGFVHAKTMVVDDVLSLVGTANLDNRSFNLNFEINALVYNKDFAMKLAKTFYSDLENSYELTYDRWLNRPFYIKIFEKISKLFSALL